MNRDAKIGIVVILIIVGLLVIIWGRSERSNEELLAGDPTTGKTPTGLSPNSLGPSSGRADEALSKEARAVSPEGIRVVSSAQLPLPPARSIPDPDGKKPAVPETAEPKPAPKHWEYTVTKDDLALEQIARSQLGDGKRWPEIAKLNNIPKPYVIHVGDKLKMPARETATIVESAKPPVERTTTTPTPTTAGRRRYIVKTGDIGVMQIAREQLGDAGKWKTIVELNNLQKPYRVNVGDVLLLPE